MGTDEPLKQKGSGIRINDLARELEVKSKMILDLLPNLGVTEPKTHSSPIDNDTAERVRQHILAIAQAEARAEAAAVAEKTAKEAAAKAARTLPAAAPSIPANPPAAAKPAAPGTVPKAPMPAAPIRPTPLPVARPAAAPPKRPAMPLGPPAPAKPSSPGTVPIAPMPTAPIRPTPPPVARPVAASRPPTYADAQLRENPAVSAIRPLRKKEILATTDFGHRIAEEEAKDLIEYFVETNQWKSVFSGNVDVVYGAKGSGKSAIYSLLLGHKQQLADRGISILAAENPRGATVFRQLVADPPADEEEFRGLWKLYFLCLVGNYFHSLANMPDAALQIVRHLEEAQLLPPDGSLSGILRSVLNYVRRAMKAESVGIGIELDPITGTPSGVIGRITLREPGFELRDAGLTSVDGLLRQADEVLASEGLRVWILLDRLDVAFLDSAELESNALRALFRVYLDMAGFNAIDLKIFLRTDIWTRIQYIGVQGFPEASHIVRTTIINWNAQSLLNLVVRRLLHNETIRNAYGVDANTILADTEKQIAFFLRVFPRGRNLDWMMSRIQDGSTQTAPRELIHLLHCAKEIQMRRLEIGGHEPDGEALFDPTSFDRALPEVSKARFDQTLCAEYPQWRQQLLRLKGDKPNQTLQSLAKLWQQSESDAMTTTENLIEIGFFEKYGDRDRPLFWVPFLYQPALEMKSSGKTIS